MSEYFGYVTINVTRSPLRLYNIPRIPLHPPLPPTLPLGSLLAVN